MHFISFPAQALPSRWRPDGQVGAALSGWTPAQRQAWAQGRGVNRLGQATTPVGARETPTELGISVLAAGGAVLGGLSLAFGAKKNQTTLMWIGILASTIGGLKLLQTGSKWA